MEDLSRANISTGYLVRLGLVALFGVALAGWCIYDGTVTYPNQRVRALKFLEIQNESTPEADRIDKWIAVATENGWPLENPGKPKAWYDFVNQFIFAGAVGPFGLVFLFLVLRARGRWIEASDTGLTSSWGPNCDYGEIATLDKKKWHNKGIAVVNYQQGGGSKRLVLDDCKYDRYATEFILRKVESEIDPDQIVNGPAESLPASETEPTDEPADPVAGLEEGESQATT